MVINNGQITEDYFRDGLYNSSKEYPKLKDGVFQFLDDYGNAFMVNDPIPNGSLGIASYGDNLLGGIMAGIGKAGKYITKTDDVANILGKAFSGGKAGEKYLAEMVGGSSQQYFKTTVAGGRGRFIDQLADGIAHESKVGYTTLTSRVHTQILKDAELIKDGLIDAAEWHFFRSADTGKIGASKQLMEFLTENGIKYTIHK